MCDLRPPLPVALEMLVPTALAISSGNEEPRLKGHSDAIPHQCIERRLLLACAIVFDALEVLSFPSASPQYSRLVASASNLQTSEIPAPSLRNPLSTARRIPPLRKYFHDYSTTPPKLLFLVNTTLLHTKIFEVLGGFLEPHFVGLLRRRSMGNRVRAGITNGSLLFWTKAVGD
jgi:hypothetical protein